MKCSKIQNILLDYVYGELEPEDAVKVEEHVRACAQCAAELKEMEFTSKVFKKADARVPSNHAVERLFKAASDALNEPKPVERRIIRLFSRETLRPFLAGAASVALIIGVVMWLAGPSRPAQPGEQIVKTQYGTPAQETGLIMPVSADYVSNVEAVYADANEKFLAGRYATALILYDAIDRGMPKFRENYKISERIGDLLVLFGQKKDAVKYYEKSVEQNPARKDALSGKIEQLNAELKHVGS
jgi:tetratricopeptide (TPR) repeat protein